MTDYNEMTADELKDWKKHYENEIADIEECLAELLLNMKLPKELEANLT
mgnify:CR=1 FL=1